MVGDVGPHPKNVAYQGGLVDRFVALALPKECLPWPTQPLSMMALVTVEIVPLTSGVWALSSFLLDPTQASMTASLGLCPLEPGRPRHVEDQTAYPLSNPMALPQGP